MGPTFVLVPLRVERVEEEEQVKRVHMEHKNGKKFLCLCLIFALLWIKNCPTKYL